MKRLAAPLALILTTWSGPLQAATFTVQDVRSAREISEVTELYIEDQLVASFRLDDTTRHRTVTVQVPTRKDPTGREQLRYDLCGTITIRGAGGAAEIHEVNATGILHDPDQRQYEALGAEDFSLFYLSDPSDPGAADSIRQRSGLCHAAISWSLPDNPAPTVV